jgi:hypothetical protein
MSEAHARNSDPVTSHEAADAASHLLWPSHRLVERILRDHPDGMTAKELEQAAIFQYGWKHSESRIRSAPAEMKEEGLTFVAELVRRPGDSRRRQLWKLVDA